MYDFQYLVGGALSFVVSTYILVKRPKSLALRLLFLFGMVVTMWEASIYLGKTAPDLVTATSFYRILLLSSTLSFPLYLLTVLSIRANTLRNTRVTIFISITATAEIVLFKFFLEGVEVFPTDLGWSYRVIINSPLFMIYGIILVGYMGGTLAVLLNLSRKTMQPLLKRKYVILLASFVLFQLVGTVFINTLAALGFWDPDIKVGGILQFLTFLSIWYALTLKEEGFLISLGGNGFSKVYSSFLTVFHNSVVGSSLGEEFFKFTDFIRRSKIENQVSIASNRITFKDTEDLDLAELIDRNLNALAEGRVDDEVVDQYLRVLNAADQELGWKFEGIVKANEDSLKRFDLIYGISEGRFLERIVRDESLRNLGDIDACLKIYKRILLQIMKTMKEKTEFRKKLSEHYVTSAMKITDYGEVSMKGVRDRALSMPRDQRLSFIVERFNSILSWAYETILADPNADIEEILRKLRLVLTLNEDRAVELGVYPTLLGTLATKIPQTQVHRLYSDYLEELVEERTEELKKTQQELLKSQRLAAIGEVAAMVGHDLRNPLQAIVNMMYLTKEKLNSTPLQGSELVKLADTVEEQVRYMNKIVSDLEDFARPLKVELDPTDLHKMINETLSSIRVPDSVKVSIVTEDDLDFPKLTVDAALMKRVFINLITNALQAMPDGGDLKIAATRMEDSALIRVQDTGVGIPEENIDKIFQPLFSTKAKGQGLGLAVCKRLVEAHNGSITFESKVGKGSTFTVEIPLRYMAGNQKEPQIIARAA